MSSLIYLAPHLRFFSQFRGTVLLFCTNWWGTRGKQRPRVYFYQLGLILYIFLVITRINRQW